MSVSNIGEIVSVAGFGFGIYAGFILPPSGRYRSEVRNIEIKRKEGLSITPQELTQVEGLKHHWLGFLVTWFVGLLGLMIMSVNSINN